MGSLEIKLMVSTAFCVRDGLRWENFARCWWYGCVDGCLNGLREIEEMSLSFLLLLLEIEENFIRVYPLPFVVSVSSGFLTLKIGRLTII